VRIDLHTHSRASDGTQSPGDVVRAAAAAGLDVVGLTDHDTTAGWHEAAQAALVEGVSLVRGIEVSTRHRGRGVHLLAYLPDPTYEPLRAQLGRILEGRATRIPEMLDRLAKNADIHLTVDDVRRASPDTSVIGRPHVADAIVAAGHAADRSEVFARLVGQGGPAYVDRYAAPLLDMVRIVGEAGGVAVVAHAWGRHGPAGLSERDLADLAERGLAGLEVDHQDHDAPARDRLRGLARDLDLVVTGSSDYHGLGKVDHDLGCNTTTPDDYARLLELAAASAERSGRATVPTVVGA